MHLFPQTPHFAIMAWLFAGLVLLLTLASGVGYALNRRHGAQRSAVVDNLNARIRAWWWMVGILGLAFAFGQDVTLALFAVASFFSLREFISLTPTRPGDHAALVAAFYVMLPAQYLLIASHWYGLFVILIPVYGFLLLPLLSAIGKDTQSFLERAAKIQWAVMITVYCLSYAPALLMLKIPSDPGGDALLLFFLIFVVQVSDVLQYVFGKMFGKTLIAPTLKSLENRRGLHRRRVIRDGARHLPLVGHPVSPVAGRAHCRDHCRYGVLRRLGAFGGQTKSWREGLGLDDRGSRGSARPTRLRCVLGAGFFPSRSVFLDLNRAPL
nr:phosphatidate cytidylyltransferase [Acidiferrobacter sp.]